MLAAIATSALSLGAVGICWAANDPAPTTSPSGTEQEDNGLDCVDGIDAATGAACDGGPAANPTDDNAEDGAEDG